MLFGVDAPSLSLEAYKTTGPHPGTRDGLCSILLVKSRTKDYYMPTLCPWKIESLEYDGCYTHFSINDTLLALPTMITAFIRELLSSRYFLKNKRGPLKPKLRTRVTVIRGGFICAILLKRKKGHLHPSSRQELLLIKIHFLHPYI